MSVLFGVALVILNEATAEAGEEFAQLLHFEPGLAPELFTIVDGEDDLHGNTVRSEPRDHPQVEAEAVGPGSFARVSDQLEARVDVHGTPLVVRYAALIEVDDLLLGEGLLIPDVLHIHLDDLEALGAVPVDKLAFLLLVARTASRIRQAMLVATQDVADCARRYVDGFVLTQIERKPLGTQSRLVLSLNHLLLDLRRGLVGLSYGGPRPIIKVTLGLFPENIVHHRTIDVERSRSIGYVAAIRFQILQHGQTRGGGVDLAQGLIVDTVSRIHSVPSLGRCPDSPVLRLAPGKHHIRNS